MTSAYKDRQGALTGRGEHTDSVSHSATWHLQVAGTKVWTIRPTEELMSTEELERSSVANGDTLTVVVSPIYLGFSPHPFFSLSFRGVILFYYSALAFPSYFVRHWRKLSTSNVLALRPFRGCTLAKTNKRKLIFRADLSISPPPAKKKRWSLGMCS